MSTTKRIETRDLLIAKIKALSLPARPARPVVEPWKGDPRAFNPDGVAVYIGVRLTRVGYGDHLPVSGQRQDRTFYFDVFITAIDHDDADAVALALCEILEAGVPGDLAGRKNAVRLAGDEEQYVADLNEVGYVQRYAVMDW